jgi:exopolysaccharide biosynthesis polyprenyl glycosylphosphotransferase
MREGLVLCNVMKVRKHGNLTLLYFLSDVVAIVAAYYATLLLRFNETVGTPIFAAINRTLGVRDVGQVGDDFKIFYIDSAPRIIFFLIITVCIIYAMWDLYALRRFIKKRPTAWHIIVSNLTALVIFYAYFYLSRNDFHPRSILGTMLILNSALCILLRGAFDRVLAVARERRQRDIHPVILVGTGIEADELNSLMPRLYSHGLFVRERLTWQEGQTFETFLQAAESTITQHSAGMLIMADPRLSIDQIMLTLEMTDRLDIAVKILSRKLDVLVLRARISGDMVNGIPLLHFSAPSRTTCYETIKGLASTAIAVVTTVILSPALLLIAWLVKATSPGPALFVQERIGVNRQPFDMFKYRTMRSGAEKEQADVEGLNESGEGLFKMRRDPRVTPIGRLLRRYSLDELPQLINVVRRDMVLVGPRPLPRRDYENYYEEWHYSRHHGLPGLTCLWQVSGRSDLDFHSMCILDVYYLRNQDWVLDTKILLRTLWVVIFAKGAY